MGVMAMADVNREIVERLMTERKIDREKVAFELKYDGGKQFTAMLRKGRMPLKKVKKLAHLLEVSEEELSGAKIELPKQERLVFSNSTEILLTEILDELKELRKAMNEDRK